jgi:NAD(P)H-nitrite reductase large subunit
MKQMKKLNNAINDAFSVIPKLNMSLITEEERVGIYNLLQKYNVTLTQITPSQRLSVFGLDDDKLELLKRDIYNIVQQHDGIHVTYVQNCPGLNHCKYAVADSLSLGRKLAQISFTDHLPNKVKVSIAGCRTCCTEPFIRDVGIIAQRKGWTLVFGGNGGGKPRIADRIAGELQEDEVVDLVKKCLDFYIKNATTRQRTARFIEQYGIDNFKKEIL